jgi:hypothetical protein
MIVRNVTAPRLRLYNLYLPLDYWSRTNCLHQAEYTVIKDLDERAVALIVLSLSLHWSVTVEVVKMSETFSSRG